MRNQTVNGYYVAGNDYLAIAINVYDAKDAHYFTPHTVETASFEMTAFDRAIAWTSPGI